MDKTKERRKYQRFDACGNILARNTLGFGQVINMSLGGLLIKYLLRQDDPFLNSFKISLLNNGGDHFIENLPCEVVAINDSGPICPPLNLFTREAGVMFADLTSSQKNQLADFVLLNTLANA